MVPPQPRPQFFTPEERVGLPKVKPAPHQKAAVLLILAKNLEQALSAEYVVDLQMRPDGGITLTVDIPTLDQREDVALPR